MGRRKPGNIMMGIAAALLFLVMLSTHLMGGLYARYASRDAGTDSARVAKFGALTVTETGDFDGTAAKKGMIIPGVPLTKDVTVRFEGSEMAAILFVEVTLSDNWVRSGDTFTTDDGYLGWAVAEGWTRLDTDGHVYYKQLEAGAPATEADFIANHGAISVSEEITEAVIGTLKNTAITIQATAVQYDGFSTVLSTWESLP